MSDLKLCSSLVHAAAPSKASSEFVLGCLVLLDLSYTIASVLLASDINVLY